MKKISFITLMLLGMLISKAQIISSDITAKEIQNHLQFLASDAMKGRYPGTLESKKSSEYIREYFLKAGLKLMYDSGFQYFDMTSEMIPGKNNNLKFENSVYSYGKDFLTYSFSSNDTLDAPVVFAGYGFDIKKDTLIWQDFNGIDIKNKWVMILTGDPGSDSTRNPWRRYSFDRNKVVSAHDLGAAGVIFVMSGKNYPTDKLEGNMIDLGFYNVDIPAIRITRKMADRLLKSKSTSIAILENELRQTKKPHSFLLDKNLNVTTDLHVSKVPTRNVVAVLPGSDSVLKNEYVVVGAHYDHLGVIEPANNSHSSTKKEIHNGADDNASGTVGLIELSKVLAANKSTIKRSIIFIAFDAEEEGLLGSKYFLAHLPIDKMKIKLMINFDMIGRMNTDQKVLIINGNGSFKESDSILNLYSNSSGMKVKFSPGNFSGSDQFSFYQEKIPVLFFFTGIHDDYHMPTDDVEKINFDGEKLVIDYAANVIQDFAKTNTTLTFREDRSVQSSSPRRYKVTLGVIPDFANTEQKGFKIDGTKKDSPAEKAGMLKGDIIQSIDGKMVNNIQDYMQRMENVEPGQTIVIEFLRNNVKQKITVTFEIKKP
jgi:aminopeptidase YwaD